MNAVPLTDVEALVEGALDVRTTAYLRPWRLPVADADLHHPALRYTASLPAGVRLRFVTDSPAVALDVEHVVTPGVRPAFLPRWDLVVDDCTTATYTGDGSARARVEFTDLPADLERPVEVWLPHTLGVRIHRVEIAPGTSMRPAPADHRPRWVTYGSSITHCFEAPGPTEMWPAIAARRLGWHLTSLGFAGMAHLDPHVARAMASLAADRFTLKVGINIHNMSSLRERTFLPLVHGFVATLRDAHPTTPITVISPVLSPARERDGTTQLVGADGSVVDVPGGLSLEEMRALLESAVELWRRRGDEHITYLDGRRLFGAEESDLEHLPDGLHPDAEGYRRMGERFATLFAAFAGGAPALATGGA